ncbi:hypothetical protein Ahy_A03g014304 [Arachis hypogaea]|uniref:SWIM-type domain-containing protein n=1 Tax=Arachis hypogaea TaxID=3818 RepID=A0A445DXC6_ARAHY|nr:hypothetical protein Ahy_A03g014304 [Arachis hypogaea]
MCVTHCDRRASIFVVDELEPFESLFWVWLMVGTCVCGLFQSLYFPCRHALATCATASIESEPYMHLVYMQEVVFKVYEAEFSPILNEKLWME